MEPIYFSGREILEMAIRIEENGERFYSDAASSAKKDKLREIFKHLAEEEKKHRNFFENLKKVVSEETSAGIFSPYLEEASLYIRAFADTEVFTKPNEGKTFAKAAGDEKDALLYAIGMEKDALLFYYEFQKSIREKDRDILDKIIKEEKEHLKKLSGLKVELYGKQSLVKKAEE